MESSDRRETGGQLKLDRAGNQNAGLVTFIHVLIVVMIVGLIVAYIVIKP